jgi:two-component system, OmpR family, alkaline phosphatase synthesis response regulator PhoP
MTSASSGPQPGEPKATVLIVDDNVQNLELLEAYMAELPEVRPITATNGIEALERVASDRPDLILLDIMMPRMSGFEVCRHVKGNPVTRDIPIIMVTALDELGDEERARECGADEFVCKPVNRADLTTRVRNLLRVRQMKNERPRPPVSRPGRSPRPPRRGEWRS